MDNDQTTSYIYSKNISNPASFTLSRNNYFFSSFILALSLSIALLFNPDASAYAKEMNIDSAINKAGKQRMLTQRIIKSYMLIGQDVFVDDAQKILDTSLATFNMQLEELDEFAPTIKIEKAIARVRQKWGSFSRNALKTPQKDQAILLIDEGDDLLALCEHLVTLLEKRSNNTKGAVINKSGRQRMLSQRIGMLYAASSWGIREKREVIKKFKIALKEYDQALVELNTSQLNNNKISKALRKVSSNWEFSRSGFDLMDSQRYVPFVIQVTTETMLKYMNKITDMYEDVSSNQHNIASQADRKPYRG